MDPPPHLPHKGEESCALSLFQIAALVIRGIGRGWRLA
jgi:hypothetical protein